MLLRNTRFEVVREAETLQELGANNWPDALLLVDHPGDVRDIEPTILSLKAASSCRIVLLAESVEADQLAWSFAAGVDGYVLEEISPEALLESLDLVLLGEKVFPSRLAVLMCEEHWGVRTHNARPRDVPLSERELEIVQRLADGLPNKTIAAQLSISEATVKAHLKTILKKLGAHNRTQAAIWAVQRGISAAPEILTTAAVARTVDLEPAA
jgi:two-component system nitrate/nitrite response regulator NarL